MLRRISKFSFLIQFLIFIGIAALIWVPVILHPLKPLQLAGDGPLYSYLLLSISNLPVFSSIISLILVLSISFIVYYLITVNDIIARENFLPAILCLIFLSWNSRMTALNPVLPSSLLLVFSVHTLMRIYNKTEPYREVFSASFTIGLASMFYLPAAYFIFMIWMTLITYRLTKWREWIIVLIGFLIVFIYLLSWFYVTDNLQSIIDSIGYSLLLPGFSPKKLGIVDTIWLFSSAIILIITLTSAISATQDKLISIRRKSRIMVNYVIALVVMLGMTATDFTDVSQLLGISLAFFAVLSLGLIKKSLMIDLMLSAYLVFLLVAYFIPAVH